VLPKATYALRARGNSRTGRSRAGRGHLGDVVAQATLIQHAGELRPGHALGDRVDDLHAVDRVQQRGELGQRNLRPEHVLARAAPDTVLAADPDLAVGRGRVDQQDVDRLRVARRGQQALRTIASALGKCAMRSAGMRRAPRLASGNGWVIGVTQITSWVAGVYSIVS
jgi:hypothetical protein